MGAARLPWVWWCRAGGAALIASLHCAAAACSNQRHLPAQDSGPLADLAAAVGARAGARRSARAVRHDRLLPGGGGRRGLQVRAGRCQRRRVPDCCPLLVSTATAPWRAHLAPGTWHLAPGAWRLAPGAWRLAPGAWRLVPGAWCLVPGAGHLAPGAWCLAPGAWCLAPGTWDLAPGTWDLVPGTCLAPGTHSTTPALLPPRVDALYLWNVASWDLLGIHWRSYSQEGSYYEPGTVGLVGWAGLLAPAACTRPGRTALAAAAQPAESLHRAASGPPTMQVAEHNARVNGAALAASTAAAQP